jgi:hypothetical protein
MRLAHKQRNFQITVSAQVALAHDNGMGYISCILSLSIKCGPYQYYAVGDMDTKIQVFWPREAYYKKSKRRMGKVSL